MASQLWYAWSNYYWYQRYGMRLYQRSHTIPYPCGMIIWNGMTLELTYHTIWYECMEWYGFGIHISYHMVWVSGMVTIPYGMSVWNGMALESTYHTIWYGCLERLPYHMVWVYGMVWLWNPHTIPCNMIVWRYDFDVVQWHCQLVVSRWDHSGIHLLYSTLARDGIHMSACKHC